MFESNSMMGAGPGGMGAGGGGGAARGVIVPMAAAWPIRPMAAQAMWPSTPNNNINNNRWV